MDLILNIFQFILLIELVYGRGSMLNPPQRSSLWRFRPWKKDKNIPKNLEDYGLNCGGFWRLHGVNKGKCGVCGDPYDAVSRQNEADGKYANGIIVRRYRKHQKFINVTIDITANIGGHFEFRICPNNNVSAVVTQECLDKHRLTVEGHGLKFNPRTDKKYKLALHMPKNITCSQCVLQWKWRGSYNWGRCDDGYQDVGCGNQEEYYNCADIAILPRRRRRPKKKPNPPTKKSTKITAKEKPKVDKIQTIAPSKDVKTMSKDINDIKSIDKMFSQQTNQVDPTGSGHAINPAVVSGIPVYMFKQETSTTLPPIDITLVPTKIPVIKQPPKFDVKPPKIFIGNKIEESNNILLEPVPVQNMPTIVRNDINIPPSVTDVKDNTIFDLASANVMNGMRQDLVQSPGNNIFNKAEWITGTTATSPSGVGASGEGNASASLSANAITNASLTQMLSNTAFNSSAEQIGVIMATDETTLDPLTVNRNANMLSDMFYGAMLAGGETELDGLFPMSLFPTVTQAQPFGDLANQFMHSVIAMNAQRKANSTLQQGTFSNPTKSGILVSSAQTRSTATVDGTDSGKFQSSSTLSTNVVTPNSFSIKSNTASQLTSANKISVSSDTTSSSGTGVMATTRAAGNTVGKMSTLQITNTAPYFTKQTTLSKIAHPSNIMSTGDSKSSSLYETSTIQSTAITQQVMNPISGTRDETTITPPTTVNPWQEVLVQMNSLLNNLNNQLDTFVHGSNTVNNALGGSELAIGSKPDQSNASTLTKTTEVKGIPSSWNVKPPLIGKSQSIQLFKPRAAFSKDGVVVSDVGGVPVHHPDQIFMDQPSNDIINQVDTSWRKLSQEPTTVFMNNILNNNIKNNRQTTTETPFQKITPIVISDPKSKFSFKRLDARNVDINNLPVSQRQVASNQHFVVSEPLMQAIESSKQTSSAIVDPIPKTRVSGIKDIVIGQSLEQFTQDDALQSFKKPMNDVSQRSEQSPRNKVDFWDAAQNILSVNNTRTQNSMTKTADIIGSPNSLQNPNKVLGLAKTILSLNKKKSQDDLMRPNPAPPVNKPVRINENLLNIWNTIINPNHAAPNKRSPPAVAPTADIQTLVNSFSNLMNKGIFVIPTTPKSLPVRRTRPANVYTGVTENILDVMSRIWNQNSLFSANTIG